MIKLDETEKEVAYFIDSIGKVTIKKDYSYKQLTSVPITISKETNDCITYSMPDGKECHVSKDKPMSAKEVIVRYWTLKNFNGKANGRI